jgi:aryl-alcohol dehydrogenase-like predicted oxidoreductase
MCQPIS